VLSIATASNSSSQVCSRCGLYHGVDVACPVASALPVRDAGRLLSRGDLLAGRFRIGSVIHRSTMSTIYRALDLSQQVGVVAIKQVSVAGLPPAEQAEARGWLAREAGLLSFLNDSHLPKLISAFSDCDLHYVVMPYLAGESLKERVKSKGPLPEDEAVSLARDMTDALAYLHGQDPPIVHRDLKPDNVLIAPDGHVLLLDLGVARPVRRGQVGTAIGTPGYAAPEQYQGLADERSDLYALGATLHYMLTGYDAELGPPFQHPPVRAIRPQVSPECEELVARLLQVVPDRRMRSAAASACLQAIDELREATAARLLCQQLPRRAVVETAPFVAWLGVIAVAVQMDGFGLWIPVINGAYLLISFAGERKRHAARGNEQSADRGAPTQIAGAYRWLTWPAWLCLVAFTAAGLLARFPVGAYWPAFCFLGLVALLSGVPSRLVQLRTARALEMQARGRWHAVIASDGEEPAKLGVQRCDRRSLCS